MDMYTLLSIKIWMKWGIRKYLAKEIIIIIKQWPNETKFQTLMREIYIENNAKEMKSYIVISC